MIYPMQDARIYRNDEFEICLTENQNDTKVHIWTTEPVADGHLAGCGILGLNKEELMSLSELILKTLDDEEKVNDSLNTH